MSCKSQCRLGHKIFQNTFPKKKGLYSPGQPGWRGRRKGGGISSEAALTLPGGDRSPAAPVVLGSHDLIRDDGHCEEAIPWVVRRQRQPHPTTRVDTLLRYSQRDLPLPT